MKKLLLIIGVLVIVGGALGFYLYNKPHKSMVNMKVTLETTSEEITSAYQEDEGKADEQFLGNVIKINGSIQSIEQNDQITIVLNGVDLMSTVRCQLDLLTVHPEFGKLKPNDLITVKGICTGYLMDVILDRCIILTHEY